MVIDPHVHCRDEEESYKATIAGTIKLALEQGIDIICDMPNTFRPVISRQRVEERLALVPSGLRKHYRLYVGLTADPDQIAEAVYCYNHFPEVVGLKFFAGPSVGSLSVVDIDDQRRVYQTLTKLEYRGIMPAHCEKQSELKPELWQPKNPSSHNLARPSRAEAESVKEQIALAQENDFTGVLHICHVTSWSAIFSITEARKHGMRITCGVTPHHLLFSDSVMWTDGGLSYKVNPPLRDYFEADHLRAAAKMHLINWIETDHAPHALEEKQTEPYVSGHPSLNLYRRCVDQLLPSLGLSSESIAQMTCDNIVAAFDGKL